MEPVDDDTTLPSAIKTRKRKDDPSKGSKQRPSSSRRVKSAGYEQPDVPRLKKTVSAPPEADSAMKAQSAPARGRKKTVAPSKPSIPDDRKCFCGKTFFFCPNDKVHPARKLRIEKVIAYGGHWLTEWSQEANYVVVDKSLSYQDLMTWLKLEVMPDHITVVGEEFITDSIQFGRLVDGSRAYYRVIGAPEKDGANKRSTSPAGPPELGVTSAAVKKRKKDATTPSPRRSLSTTPVQREAETASDQASATTEQMGQVEGSNFSGEYADALSEAMKEVITFQHLPIDESDSDEASSQKREQDSDFEEKRFAKRQSFNQKSYSCMQKNDGLASSGNPNARTIEILDEMAKYYDRMQDNWRTLAYRKAVSALKKQTIHITTKEEALKIHGIGERLATKIEEIAHTNGLRRLESTMDDLADKTMQTFMQIYGVGYCQAAKWFNAGFKTIDDLKANAKLTDNQRIGIEHLDDFNSRIPRAEVAEHHSIVQKVLQEVDPTFEATVMGSYRRGATSSGDIDVMITKRNGTAVEIHSVFVSRLLPKLFEIGFLKVGLATTSSQDVNGSKWHGASALPGSTVWRRIDFLLVPWEEVGAALIYFTGNDIFNRSIRLLASTKGMRLNQHGLYKNVMRGKNRVKITEGELVESRSEEKIFEILGVSWRPPHHRIA